MRIKWGEGPERVSVVFFPKGTKNQVTVQHGRLPNAVAAKRTQEYWRERLEQLRRILEK